MPIIIHNNKKPPIKPPIIAYNILLDAVEFELKNKHGSVYEQLSNFSAKFFF